MSNVQDFYVNNVRSLSKEERQQLANLILDELSPTSNGERQNNFKDEVLTQPSVNGESDEAKEVRRQKSAAWIKANRVQYGGFYVALNGDHLIGTGKRYGDALKVARQAGIKNAFVEYVLPLDSTGEIGVW